MASPQKCTHVGGPKDGKAEMIKHPGSELMHFGECNCGAKVLHTYKRVGRSRMYEHQGPKECHHKTSEVA